MRKREAHSLHPTKKIARIELHARERERDQSKIWDGENEGARTELSANNSSNWIAEQIADHKFAH